MTRSQSGDGVKRKAGFLAVVLIGPPLAAVLWAVLTPDTLFPVMRRLADLGDPWAGLSALLVIFAGWVALMGLWKAGEVLVRAVFRGYRHVR